MLQQVDLSENNPASPAILNSSSFTSVTNEQMVFLDDVHSWKWYWACGMRLLIVGLGVSV